jgi:hypothetical protein
MAKKQSPSANSASDTVFKSGESGFPLVEYPIMVDIEYRLAIKVRENKLVQKSYQAFKLPFPEKI